MKMRRIYLLPALILTALICILLPGCGGRGSGGDQTGGDGVETGKQSEKISVVLYGAAGDGVTDDSGAINAAIDSAVREGHDVYFPEGRYLVKKSVTFPEGTAAVFADGAVIVTVGTRKLVSFGGGVEAGNYRIFEGDGIGKALKNSHDSGNPVWFGATGDGVTDDTKAFLAAWEIFSRLSVPYSENGYVLSGISSAKGMILSGADPERRTVIKAAAVGELFTVKAPGYFTVENIAFDLSEMPDGSTAFFLDTVGYMEYIFIRNCSFTDGYHCFTDAKSSGLVMHMYVEETDFIRNRNSTFDIEDFEGFIFMKKILIDNSGSYKHHGLDRGITAIDIDDVRGTIFEEMTLIGGNSGFPDERGFNIPGQVQLMASLWWDRVEIRDMSGCAVYLNNTTLCSLVHVTVKNCGEGIRIGSSWDVQLSDVNVSDVKKGNGIYLSSCRNSEIYGCTVDNAAKSGVKLASCTGVSVTGITVRDCGEYGYCDMNGSKTVLISSECTGNRKAQVSVTGSVSSVYDTDCGNGKRVTAEGKGEW